MEERNIGERESAVAVFVFFSGTRPRVWHKLEMFKPEERGKIQLVHSFM